MLGIKLTRCSYPLLMALLIHLLEYKVDCSSAMKRLYEDLFTDYNRLILPVANNKTKVTVTLGLKLGQILDLNLKQQILSTNVWVEQTWHDFKLQWEPAQYEGIDMIHVPAENIWIPDIVLFNNADGNYELTLVAKARLYSNGTVVWKPPTMFRSTCEIDVEYFPFDIQTCFLRFGSWTYAGDEVELRPVGSGRKVDIGIDLSQFYKNVEWDIIDVPAYYNEVYYDCCTEPFPDITFKIVIRRKMLFYLVNLILPVALMTFMTVSVFYLPSDSNEKVTLSISILTSLIVFFLLMLEIIPASSLAVPLFGKYLLFTLVLVSLSACLSVYVLNIHHRSPSVHQMSPRVRKIFLETLPKLLRLNRPDPHERSSLNRFRKKKIAQQMLNQSAANKVYDLAQPLAASLNLIETLHKSYDFNPKDDGISSSTDDEGRYFRKYVDNYISRLKKVKAEQQGVRGMRNEEEEHLQKSSCNCESRRTISCCEHNKCCSRANETLHHQNQGLPSSCCGTGGRGNNDWTGSSVNLMCSGLISNKITNHLGESANNCNNCSNRSRSLHHAPDIKHCQTKTSCGYGINNVTHHQQNNVGMLNDDTLDMTFDYDYELQDNNNITANGARCSGASAARQQQQQQQQQQSQTNNGNNHEDEEELPSPPPPPRQLTQLSDSIQQNKSGRVSSCSRNITSNSSDESCSNHQLDDHGCLVDKLINSIHLINNASDDIDTTTLSNNETTDDEPKVVTMQQTMQQQASFDHVSPLILGSAFHTTGGNSSQLQEQQLRNRRMQHQTIEHQSNCDMSSLFSNLHQSKSIGQNGVNNSTCTCSNRPHAHIHESKDFKHNNNKTVHANGLNQPSDLLMSLRLSYDQMPAHVRAAIRSILFIADTIKNEDDENSAIEDWESMSMVVDRLFLWIFFLLCTFGSLIILALAPSLYDQRASIDDKLRLDIPLSNCSANTVV